MTRLCFGGLGNLQADDATRAPRDRAAADRRVEEGEKDRHNGRNGSMFRINSKVEAVS